MITLHRKTRSIRSKSFMLVMGLVVWYCFSTVAFAVQSEEKVVSDKPQHEWLDKPTDQRSDTTSAMLLKRLQETRPFNAVISSRRSRELQAKGVPPQLLPEGTRVVNSVGSIQQDGRWWIFQPRDNDQGQALRVLPCEWLEVMIRSGQGSAEPLLFSISVEITEFSGHNYVLVRSVLRIEPQQPDQATVPSKADVQINAPLDDVVAVLRNVNPQEQLLTPPSPPLPSMPPFAATSLPSVRPEGTPVIRRPGRLIEESPWWTFVLETSSHKQEQLPLKLLPNRNVELMIETISHGAEGVVFLVSGQLTLFNGENYLFPQAVTRQIDIGNLRK